jgi:MraZ protein
VEVFSMFLGKYDLTLDPKGRLSIPAKFREVLNGRSLTQLILTLFDGCIVAYPLDEWHEVERKARALPTSRRDVRNFVRVFYANAADCPLDRQGRILIPEALRREAGLEKEVVAVGVGNKIEIWGKERWREAMEATRGKLEDIAEASGIGF